MYASQVKQMLAGHFSEVTQRRLGLGPVRLNAEALDLLKRSNWPGNVRELENVLSRAILKASAEIPRGKPVVVTLLHLTPDVEAAQDAAPPVPSAEHALVSAGRSFREQVEEFQRSLVLRTVAKHGGNWAAAARELGMHRSNLHHLAARLGLRAT